MAPKLFQWGTITLHLDNETFGKALRSGRSRYCADREYDIPHVAHRMNTLDAVGSVLDEDSSGGYRLDRMAFNDPFAILGFAPSIPERADQSFKRRRAARAQETRRRITGRSLYIGNSFVERHRVGGCGTGSPLVPLSKARIMQQIITSKLKLTPAPEQFEALRQTQLAYRDALNAVSHYAYEQGKTSSVTRLHKGMYAELRARYHLPSQLACSVERQVAATYKGLWTKLKKNDEHRRKQITRKRFKGLDQPPRYSSPPSSIPMSGTIRFHAISR